MAHNLTTNIMSYQANVALKKSSSAVRDSMERLSTGYKINNASDNPAGLGISLKMTSQIRGYLKASDNASDAIAMLQTAEGALTEIYDLIQRMRTLAVQASSSTYTATDRAALDTEYQALEAEITRLITDTKWNTMGLLDGTSGSSNNGTFKIQVGADSGMTITLSIGTLSTASGGTLNDLAGLAVSTTALASSAITNIDLALSDLSLKRSAIGSYTTRLESALDNVLSMAVNLTESRSKMMDTDYAEELSNLARNQIVQEMGTAVLAQANKQPELVLTLLRSL